MATLGLQILMESDRELISQSRPEMDPNKEKWMIGIMMSVTAIKKVLIQQLVFMLCCGRFKNEIVRAYAQDHFFDVITNSVGLATAVLAIRFFWWIDSTGAIIIALYTMDTWEKTVLENVWSLIGRTAPPELFSIEAHNIGETLQEKLEQLNEVERAFVDIDFEFTHRPEHKPKKV
ncbi:hypothetical protein MKX01_017025 [Papaver californicum]|nr:hypothetical protein MKX01_017025 [Papaver californicum]